LRILWVSDSPTSPSGFGGVTAAVCRRLAQRGHRVEILGWQSHGAPTWWEGIPVHPVQRDAFGADVLLGYLMRLQPDFLVTLGDVWWMSFLADPPIQRHLDMSGTRWVHYYPVDGAAPDGRLPAGWVSVLEAADLPIAMSRFGADVTRACGVSCEYIPHGVDLDVFRPPPNKDAAKRALGYDGRFVVLSDARNQPRKLLPRLLDVLSAFAERCPDVLLHLHCDPNDDAADSELYGYRLLEDLDALGIADVCRLTANFRMLASGGLTLEQLAPLYAAADVHLLCSWGEGFGLPNLQAASAGVVPIAGAFAASRELVEGHGFALPAEATVRDEFGLVRSLVDRGATVAALAALYDDRALLAERSARSREFALAYDWAEVVQSWEDVLLATPPRRRPVRSRTYAWVAGGRSSQLDDVPAPVADAAADVLTSLPEGASVEVRVAERRQGEVAAEIRREAFVHGDELSIPVRLAPAFEGAPRAIVGNLLVSPADLRLAVLLRRIFPSLRVSVPTPGGDPVSPARESLEDLLAPLPHYALVLDTAGDGTPGVDVACAALGIPFLGPSALWPRVRQQGAFRQARLLLTDQALSEARRRVAAERVERLCGHAVVEALRARSLAGQPAAAPPGEGNGQPVPSEMLLVRPRSDGADAALERIADFVSVAGGLILMATPGESLIVAMPAGGKQALEALDAVEFASGLSLDEDAQGARFLKGLFARNAARQLVADGPIAVEGR
jgi:glycosyltransferase involved in cell wall biosynthesis